LKLAVAVAALALLGLIPACNALVGIPGSETPGAADATPVRDAGRDHLAPQRDAGDGGRRAQDAGRDVASDSARDVAREAAEAAADAGNPDAAVAVSSGMYLQNWCVVTGGGDVLCWGDNETGQLGDGTGLSSTTPVKIDGFPGPVAEVSVGLSTVCALTRSGGAYCWGYGQEGERGDGNTTTAASVPQPVVGLTTGVVSLSTANMVGCAVKTDGTVWCWGDGYGGTLGNGTQDSSAVPVQVAGLSGTATAVSVGGDVVCALLTGGTVECWGGYQLYGDLGNGSLDQSFAPVAVSGLTGVKAIAAGYTSVCALTTGGAVECWGEGDVGELGNGAMANDSLPVQVTGLSTGVTAVSTGNNSACAIKQDGSVWCWGYGDDGELGTGTIVFGSGQLPSSDVPVQVQGISGRATSISVGGAPCVTTASGGVDCWGLTAEVALAPVSVVDLVGTMASVSLGGSRDSRSFACALGASGQVDCWGGNAEGQLGNGNSTSSLVPVRNTTLITGATAVATGAAADFACGITSGVVMCWGDNSAGQLGNNSTTSTSTPVSVQGLPAGEAASVSVGHETACAVTTGGAAYCWGDNTFGELGNDSAASSSVAVPVQGLGSGVSAVSVGIDYACALLTGGTVQCWGNNTSGTLGNGTTTLSQVPVPVSSLTGATSIATGWYSACAVTSAGGVECWGDNFFAELGNNTTSSSTVPVASSVTGIATAVAVGWESACAVVGGGVQCWGSQALGDGSGDVGYVPEPVSNILSGATAVAVGLGTACAVVSGTVQCWGSNSAGQLGSGEAGDDLSATAVPGFP
jgi:alpha-tubulin suppressor-like RCC1 family protein